MVKTNKSSESAKAKIIYKPGPLGPFPVGIKATKTNKSLGCGCLKDKCTCDPYRHWPPVCCKDCPRMPQNIGRAHILTGFCDKCHHTAEDFYLFNGGAVCEDCYKEEFPEFQKNESHG